MSVYFELNSAWPWIACAEEPSEERREDAVGIAELIEASAAAAPEDPITLIPPSPSEDASSEAAETAMVEPSTEESTEKDDAPEAIRFWPLNEAEPTMVPIWPTSA